MDGLWPGSATPAHKAGPGRGRWARAPGFLSREAWGVREARAAAGPRVYIRAAVVKEKKATDFEELRRSVFKG